MLLPALNYHTIGEPSSERFVEWVIDRATFARQMDFLLERGLRGVTMAAALTDPRPDQVALTFDDGYEDFVTDAVPELEARGFRATVFVATGYVGSTAGWLAAEGAGDRPVANWAQLRDVDQRGFEVGSHSHAHPQLDLLDPVDLRRDITTSRDVLKAELGRHVEGFCYPHGFHNRRVRQAVIDAGFGYACGVKHKLGSVDQDRFSIARIVVRRDDSLDRMDRWLRGEDLRPGGRAIEKTLASGYRLYRRARARP